VQFTPESQTALDSWWLRNPAGVDEEQLAWHLAEIGKAISLIEHDEWARLLHDEDQTSPNGRRFIVHLPPEGLHLVIEVHLNEHHEEVAHIVSVVTTHPGPGPGF
jgi:hypothetical protein